MDIVLTFQLVVAIVIALFVAYNVFHYVLFLLVTRPRDASRIVNRFIWSLFMRVPMELGPDDVFLVSHESMKQEVDASHR